MEPVDGEPLIHEPVVGWRVWAVAYNCLFSIAMKASWRPGENQAECRVGHKRDIPVSSCHCGFWALHNPVAAIELAVQVEQGSRLRSRLMALDPHRTVAVGLTCGYGAIAMHGSEGYRAELASVACIFSDAPEPLVPAAVDPRRRVAEAYGVPCLTLEEAISIGFLQELGVARQTVDQLKAWIEAGRPLQPREPLQRRHPPRCSFCGKRQDEVRKLIAGPGVFICDRCVKLFKESLQARGNSLGGRAWKQSNSGAVC
jgi:hypothetical protein